MRGAGLPLCVQPNAGLPRTVDGRLLYMATPEYFDVFARRTIQLGATMVGGCCGTTPEHVRWMAKSGAHARRQAHRGRAARAPVTTAEVGAGPRADAARRAQRLRGQDRGRQVRGLGRGQPRARASIRRRRSKAPRCSSTSGVDIVNVADAPRAMARMSNLAFCSLLLERYGIQPILHVCGRDRNLLGPDGAPARRARHRHPQPGHHHRRSAEGRRLPRGHRGLRPRLDRPAPDGRRT